MADFVYSVTELVGTSTTSIEDAIQGAVRRAGQTLKHLNWFEVTEIRGHIAAGEVDHYQVGIKLGFRHDPGKGAQ